MSLNIFFRRIDVIGLENVPESGPVIFVANHPSALIDPLIVAISLKHKIHFLAGSNWFGKGFKARFLKNQLNMIPVHRPWLSNGKEVSNDEMFEECYRSLSDQKCIILFPEASSTTVSKIRELKTGAARIKIGFEEYTNHTRTVPIIPIGLSYSNAHEFQSRVVVKIGETVEFDPLVNTENLADFYRAQTDKIQEGLKQSIIHIDNTKNEDLVKNICRLYVASHRSENGVPLNDQRRNFEFDQSVASAVTHFEETNPEGYTEMSTRIQAYFDFINEIGISDDLFEESKRSKSFFLKWVFIVLGSFIALPSLLIFFLPYQVTKIIFRKKIKSAMDGDDADSKFDNAFTGTLIFVVGMILFGLWTPIIGVIVYLFSSSWLCSIAAMLLLYPMMRFSLYYAKIALRLKNYYKGRRLQKLHREHVSTYGDERMRIIEELRKYEVLYSTESILEQ